VKVFLRSHLVWAINVFIDLGRILFALIVGAKAVLGSGPHSFPFMSFFFLRSDNAVFFIRFFPHASCHLF